MLFKVSSFVRRLPALGLMAGLLSAGILGLAQEADLSQDSSTDLWVFPKYTEVQTIQEADPVVLEESDLYGARCGGSWL